MRHSLLFAQVDGTKNSGRAHGARDRRLSRSAVCESRGSYPEHGYARTLLTRKRVGSELDMVDFGPRSLAAFEMLGRSVPVRCPKPAALPAGIRIVNPTVEILSIEVERVGKTHRA